MAKRPGLSGPETAADFPQVEPDVEELFPTNNIRFVILETGKLIERVDNLGKSIDKLESAIERGFEKASTDFKDRLALVQTPLVEIKDDLKKTREEVTAIEKKVAFVRGALWVLGGLFAIALLFVAAIARKLIG